MAVHLRTLAQPPNIPMIDGAWEKRGESEWCLFIDQK